MVEFFTFLAVLSIVLAVVTLIGHGIWVVLAAIGRAISGAGSSAARGRDCPACGKREAVIAGQCRKCGATPFVRPTSGPAPQDEILITMRRLEKLLARGAISRDDFKKLEGLIRADDPSLFAAPSQSKPVADVATSTPTSPSEAPPAQATDSDPTTTSTPDATPTIPSASSFDSDPTDEGIFDAEVIEEQATMPPVSQHRPAQPTANPAAAVPIHPLDRPESPRPTPRATAPRRTLAALLQTFMEEKNIRWGEIISGLMIVVCAVGLVVSLWATLRDSIPYLPALIFMVGTGAFHAAGQYTLRSWNLSSISRAVLIIATLLIPLNFLAAIALSGNAEERPPWTDPTYLAAIIVGLSAYGTMTFFAGRVFLGTDWWRLLAGVMGPCVGQLLINRLAQENDSTATVLSLAMIPLAGFMVATVSGLIRARRGKRLSVRRAETLLLVLGIAAFALLCAFALLVAKSAAIWTILAQLSPALSLAAGAVLATGLLIHHRTSSAKQAALRTTGTGLAIGAAFGLASCILLAWPNPELLIAVGTFSAVLLATMGLLASLPALHGFAVACGALAWIVAYHYLSGDYENQTRWGHEIVRSFFTGESAAALGVFAALIGGFAFVLARAKLERDAKSYFLGAAAIMTVSGLVAIVVGFGGFPSSHISPPTLCIYAIALAIAATVVGDHRIAWAGSAVFLAALLQAFGFIDFYRVAFGLDGFPMGRAVMFAFLTHGVICLLVGACAGRLDAWSKTFDEASRRWSGLVRPFTESALVTSLLAAPSALFVVEFHFGFRTIYLAVIAAIWLGVAIVRRWPWAFMVGHLATTLSLVTLVVALCQVDSWRDAFQPLHITRTLAVLSTWCVLGVMGRWFCRRWPTVRQLLEVGVSAQVAVATAAVAMLALAAACLIIRSPAQIHATCQHLGHWTSFLALILAALGAVCLNRAKPAYPAAHLFCGAGVCLATLVAAATVPNNTPANWLSFHVLLVGWTMVTTFAVAQSWWPQPKSQPVPPDDGTSDSLMPLIGWGCTVGAIVAVLSLVAAVRDPTGPWFAFGATVTVALTAGAAALRVRRQSLAYASTLLLIVAAIYVWLGFIDPSMASSAEILLLIYGVTLTIAVGTGFWLVVEVNSQQRYDQPFQPDSKWLPVHRCFAALLLIGLLATTWLGAAIGALQREFSNRQAVDVSTFLGLAAMVAVGGLLFALLWDRRSRTTILSLYAWGLAAQVMIIDAFQLPLDTMCLAVGISVSTYIALTGALWRRGANLAAIGLRLRISDPVAGLRNTSKWLPPLSLLGGAFALFIGLCLVLAHPDRPQRVLTASIPVLIAIGLGCLAQSGRKQVFQYLTLVMLGVSCVFLSWADIPPGLDGPFWLSRVIRLLIVCCAVSFAYTMIVGRRRDLSTDWQMSLKRVGLSAAISGLAVLASVLVFEGVLYLRDPTLGAAISDIQLIAVSVVMVGLVAALITMAVLPGRDPLGLSEQGRTCYVYAAQVAGGLLFAHIFLTRPLWFGNWGEFWPYIILIIAFAGAGVGELFQRTGIRVLADPLQRTGTFLPLLPAIGMWFVASNSDYSLLLFGAGILYMALSIGRKSLASAIAAGIAANGALWSLLDDRGLAILSQPQLWLIPPALSVLIAAEINRKRLPESTMTTLRYVGMMVIYLSSVGEIFIRGVGETLWPPMVLLGLSLVGAMAGIVLRIRAFLYLGVTFILLSMISMVWHAKRSINHVWPWWAFGIGLGLCILVFFGYFEKNRGKVMALVERLKAWQP